MSGWIKCSDKLPSNELDGMAVIVTVTDPRGRRISEVAVWNKGSRSGKGRFGFWGNKVTHWQTLPTPPGDQKSARFNSTEPSSQQQENQA